VIAAIDLDRLHVAAYLAIQRGDLVRPRIAEQRDRALLGALRDRGNLHCGTLCDAVRERLA
jgi:hypothetical protein